MGLELLPQFIRENYEVQEWKHACAILNRDFPKEWGDIVELLEQFRLRKSWITQGGGRKSLVAASMVSTCMIVAGRKKPSRPRW